MPEKPYGAFRRSVRAARARYAIDQPWRGTVNIDVPDRRPEPHEHGDKRK
jgi:hypothetical protein